MQRLSDPIASQVCRRKPFAHTKTMRSTRVAGLGIALVAALAAGCVDPAAAGSPFDTPIASEHGAYRITVDTANSELQRGENTLTVHVVDASGAAATLTHVSALMPVHGHTATPNAVVERELGTYEVEGLDLLMAGEWQITFTASQTGASDDDAVFVAEVP